MGYFKSIHSAALEAGIDISGYLEKPRTKKSQKKLKNPCQDCLNSEATRGKLCLWCSCKPTRYRR